MPFSTIRVLLNYNDFSLFESSVGGKLHELDIWLNCCTYFRNYTHFTNFNDQFYLYGYRCVRSKFFCFQIYFKRFHLGLSVCNQFTVKYLKLCSLLSLNLRSIFSSWITCILHILRNFIFSIRKTILSPGRKMQVKRNLFQRFV